MDPMTMYLIASAIGAGGSAVSGALSGGDQELEPYHGSVDPEALLATVLPNIEALQRRIAGQSFSLPDAYVRTPPGYSGGGLPMRIGLSGSDPRAGVGLKMSDVVSYGSADAPGLDFPVPDYLPARRPTSEATYTGNQAVTRVGRRAPRTTAPSAGADDALSALELLRGARRPSGGM